MAKVKADLRDTRNGKTHSVVYDIAPELAANAHFYWTEGNLGCDCNRSLRMYGDDGELPCNSTANVIELIGLCVDGVNQLEP